MKLAPLLIINVQEKDSNFRDEITFIAILMKEDLLKRITILPDICHGKPTIRGLRYPVENMLELLAAGMTHEEILADYPDLEEEDLLACLAYAVRVTQTKSVYPLAS